MERHSSKQHQKTLDDKEKLIHFRSAARMGWSDMGVNRKRMRKIRELYKSV